MESKELNETVERARVALANANWDASKHQRGAGGRFVKGGGSESSAKDEPKEYELDETASKYGLKPGAIVGLKLMDGGKRNYRITEVLEDGSYRVEQADKPGCNMERVKPSAVTVKRPVSKDKEKPAGKKLFHDIGEGDSVWVTQNGKDKKYKVKSFYRDAHRFDGGFFTLVDDKGNEVGADSAWVNK